MSGGNQSEAHSGLVKSASDYILYRGGWIYKVWGSAFSRKGVPDLLGCYAGRLIAIECKTGKAVLDRYQQHEREKLERAGALYVLCRQVEDLERALVAAGLCEPALLALGG